MQFFPTTKGSHTISKALELFTTAQDELSKGIAQSQVEANNIKTQITDLSTELTEVNDAASKAQKVHDNITKLLED